MSKLFVGNLPFKVTDADLQNWFESNGYPVESAQVMIDHKTGRSRGIGFVALNTQTGEVIGKIAARHTSKEFVAFLAEIVAHQPTNREIHIIADNLSAHKTKRVGEFLSGHKNLAIHFTPTYSSWLNQVEPWFNKIERDVIARGVFSSTSDLSRKLMRYIRQVTKTCGPSNGVTRMYIGGSALVVI